MRPYARPPVRLAPIALDEAEAYARAALAAEKVRDPGGREALGRVLAPIAKVVGFVPRLVWRGG